MRIYIVSTSGNSTRRSMRLTPASGDTKRHFQVARSAGYDPASDPGSAELSEGMDMTYERCSPTLVQSDAVAQHADLSDASRAERHCGF